LAYRSWRLSDDDEIHDSRHDSHPDEDTGGHR
jgi:hypothetical protein